MATIHWTTVQGYVTIAATGFGIGNTDPTSLPRVNLADLSGPTNSPGTGGIELWNYGIPRHDIAEDGVAPLIEWFVAQFHGSGLRVQAKRYGGFMVNLTRQITDLHGIKRKFNFHIKIKPATMSLGTLHSSGATGKTFSDAWNEMFPPLPSSKN